MNAQIQTSSEKGEWIWMLNPTVAGTFTYADQTNSAAQIARGATANTVTNGIYMGGGYATSDSGGFGSGVASSSLENARTLGAAIDGTPDTMVLCWRPIGGSAGHEIEAGISWRELL